MGRPSKRAKVVRRASDFDLQRLLRTVAPPLASQSVYAWQLEDIRSARDAQMRGDFKRPAQLAASMRTDDALFVAKRTRLEPLRSVAVELVAAGPSSRAKSVQAEAEALYGNEGIAITAETIASIDGDLVDHGVGFGVLEWRTRDDGSRVDLFLKHWPIEWVRWDAVLRCFTTQVEATLDSEPSFNVPIVHGDGRWVVFQKHESEPWRHEACVVPGAMVWAARAFGMRDWAQSSKAHGSAKMFGEMPEGTALVDGEGAATPEAAAFLAVLDAVMSGTTLVGLRPNGAKTDFVANASTNWQIFSELATNREKAAARIYLGTDGTLGATGGAPGVDISALFGIATTIMQGDAECIEQALFTGVLQPWCAVNFGDSLLVPRRIYQLPDADAERVQAAAEKRLLAFHEAAQREKELGVLTQARLDELARLFNVSAPTLPAPPGNAPTQPAQVPVSPPALRVAP